MNSISESPDPDPVEPGTADARDVGEQLEVLVQVVPDPVIQFAFTLHTLTPWAWVTPTLVAVIVGVWVLMVARGVNFLAPDPNALVEWGANFPPKTGRGEWWRLFTSIFLHGGLLHLAFNAWVLWGSGKTIERFFGNVGFLILFVMSGLAGSLASYAWNQGVPIAAIGASGAEFGMFGGLLAYIIGQHGAIPTQEISRMRSAAIQIVVLNVILGFSMRGIDNAAHIGGCVGGFVCGLLLRQRFSLAAAGSRWWRNLLCLVVSSAMLFGLARAIPPASAIPQIDGELYEVDQQAIEAFKSAINQLEQGKLTTEQAADEIEKSALTPWRAARIKLDAMQNLPPADQEDLELRRKYYRIRQDAYELAIEGLRKGDQRLQQRANQRMQESSEVVEEINRRAKQRLQK